MSPDTKHLLSGCGFALGVFLAFATTVAIVAGAGLLVIGGIAYAVARGIGAAL